MNRSTAGRAFALLMAACLLAGALPASAAGTAGDSLVTESWAERWGGELLASAEAEIAPALDEAPEKGRSGEMLTLSDGDMLTLYEGASAVLCSGSASMRVSGTLVNTTAGAAAVSGRMNPQQLYLAAGGSSAVITVSGGARISVWGNTGVTERRVVFTDVPEGTWYYDYVYAAVSAGLIDGVNASQFEPESGFTVAHAVKIAACLNQLYYDGEVSLENDPELWYRSYVDYAVANGIVGGEYASRTPDEMNSAIDRREFAVIFYNALPAYALQAINSVSAVPDVPVGSEGAAEIYALYRAGILTGMNAAGDYQPDTGLRRNEAATIVARMFDENLRIEFEL